MKRVTLIMIALICIAIKIHAQPLVIRGTVKDTVNNLPLRYACVTLLRQKDSVLETFSRANDNGDFVLRTVRRESYFLLISFPGFPDYFRKINTSEKDTMIALGIVPMTIRSNVLEEFVVRKNRYAVSVNGDTVQFAADSFKVKEYASVQDLLRRLPGLDIDRNGSITAYNRRVEKILVDGEEFFPEDPAIVLKGLQASQVNKVQVYDAKSARSQFSGVDDGQRIKTINLQLKDSARRQLSGKVSGGGFHHYYRGDANVNRLNKKEQFSVTAVATNTDVSQQDLSKGGGSEYTQIAGGIKQQPPDIAGPGIGDGQYRGIGLPKIVDGGVHYANKWDSSGLHVNINYKESDQDLDILNRDYSEYLLNADSFYRVAGLQHTDTRLQRHRIGVQLEKKRNSNTILKCYADGGITTGVFHSDIDKNTVAESDTLNSLTQHITGDRMAYYGNMAFLIEKKLSSKGRTLSISMKENYREESGHSYILSANMLRVNNVVGVEDSFYNTDQYRHASNKRLAVAGEVFYTEPLSANAYLALNYSIVSDHISSQVNSSFRPSGEQSYSQRDSAGSGHYDYGMLANKCGLTAHYSVGKISTTIGGAVSVNDYTQQDYLLNSSVTYSNVNLYPEAHLTFNINRARKLYVNYNGSVVQPSMEQVQPMVQNMDPLNITIGNAGLKPQFVNMMSIVYNAFGIKHSKAINISLSATSISDAIVLAATTDASGRRTNQYRNTDGNYNGSLGCSYSITPATGMKLGAMLNASLRHENNIINDGRLSNNTGASNLSLRLGYIEPEKYSIDFASGAGYNFNNSFATGAASGRYWSYTSSLTGWVKLPLGIELSSDINYSWQPGLATGNNNILIWNAAGSTRILKKKNIELKAAITDLLGQRTGYTKTVENMLISEHTYNLVPRHFMFSVGWNFSRNIHK